MYTDVYTGSLQTQSYIESSQKPLRKSTKQSHLDHLHHNQESDLEHLKTHLFLANTPTLRLLILIPSRTHNQSQQTHKQNLFNRVQGLHLLQKIIWNQYKLNPIPQTLINHTTLSNLNSLKNSKFVLKKSRFSQICFSEYIQRCCLLSNLSKLFNCI